MSNPIDEQTSKLDNLDNLQDKTVLQPDFHAAQSNQDQNSCQPEEVSLHDLQENSAINSENSIAAFNEEPEPHTDTANTSKAIDPQDLPSFGEDVSLPQDVNSHDFDNIRASNHEIINEKAPDHDITAPVTVGNNIKDHAVPQEPFENTDVPHETLADNNGQFAYQDTDDGQIKQELEREQSLPEYDDKLGKIKEGSDNNPELASIPVDEEPELPPELLQKYAEIAQDAERPLYFSPGESLRGRPGDEALKQKKRQLLEEYNERQKALEEGRVLNGSNASQRAPYFENTRATRQRADAVLQEISTGAQSPRAQSVGHADKSIFANVGLNARATVAPARNFRQATPNTAYDHSLAQSPKRPEELNKNSPTQVSKPHQNRADNAVKPKMANTAKEQHNDTSSHKRTAIKGASTVFLYTRQLLASIFTHSNLGVLMPETASKLGPCFPSSMPIPMFLIGFLSVAPFFWGANYIMEVPTFLSAALSTAALFILGGACGFSGITKCVAEFSSTRSDPALHTLIVVLYTILLTASLETLLDEMSAGLEPALCFGAASMLAALSGCSLEIGQTSDPVDSFGMITIKGLVFATVITLAVVFYVFPPLVAISLTGLALLLRLLLGLYLQKKGIMISRAIVCGMHLTVLIILLIYIIVAAGRMLI